MHGQSSPVPPTLTCVVPMPQPRLSQARSSARHGHQDLWRRDNEGTPQLLWCHRWGDPKLRRRRKVPGVRCLCALYCATEVGAAPQAVPSPPWRCAQHSSVRPTRPHTPHCLPGCGAGWDLRGGGGGAAVTQCRTLSSAPGSGSALCEQRRGCRRAALHPVLTAPDPKHPTARRHPFPVVLNHRMASNHPTSAKPPHGPQTTPRSKGVWGPHPCSRARAVPGNPLAEPVSSPPRCTHGDRGPWGHKSPPAPQPHTGSSSTAGPPHTPPVFP